MRVEVKVFGPQARLLGTDRLEVRLESAEPTCRSLREAIAAQAPALAESLASSRLAVNHAYAREDQRVRESDEVALIGMIGGG